MLSGRYELKGIVGQGTMSQVFEARDTRLSRSVAVKTLPDHLAADQASQARFRREAQSAVSLDHPSIVAVYDTGEDMFGQVPVPYIVMEYVDGRTLQDLIREGRRPAPERGAEIVDGVLRALGYSHGSGVVHGDLQPRNVMLTRGGEVKVKGFRADRTISEPGITAGHTSPVTGTVRYLAPEQARGERVDERSDLYAAGCLLYEVLTGRPPFTGDSPVAVAYQHVREDPVPPSQVDPGLPGWADSIALKAMAKDPAGRYQTADEMRLDITGGLSSSPTTVLAPYGRAPSEVVAGDDVAGSPPVALTGPGGPAGLAVGSRIGGYLIEERLGAGGMATVFRAVDERLARQVALKVLAPALSQDDSFRQLFMRESRAAASVDHPNVIPVFEAGMASGVLFIAMRYVRGGDVKSLIIRQGRLQPERVTAIISPVAAALDAAHSRGLVHRDVKPGNMLLEPGPGKSAHVYLADFGLARLLSQRNLDTTGQFLGTLDYMSPENIEGRSTNGQSDQYSLACSAFEMLSGSPPFSTGGGMASIYAQLSQPPPLLTSLRPELSSAVDDVFARALAKSPPDRFDTCEHFAGALAAALSWQQQDERAPGAAPSSALSIPLKPTFRYVHELSQSGEHALASFGNDGLMAELQSRILHSRGGTFLVTGFRGVGKSTLIMRALEEIVARSAPSDLVLPVTLSVARSTTTERLLFAIVRRVFETLSDSGALQRLPPPTRHALLLAYMRTSLSFKETQSEARERSASVDLGLGPGKAVKALADFAVPSVSMSAKRSHSLAMEAAFLAYSETDVEYDLMRIISMVGSVTEAAPEPRSWLRRLWPGPALPGPRRLHLVIVIDEVDKLTADAAGLTAVEELLSGIKNVLTMSGAHFLVVAGPDLHDRAIRDAVRGNGVYESVFGWRLYVPCIWDAPDRLVQDLVSANSEADARVLGQLAQYLRFKARGVPRKLLQELNSFIAWDHGGPVLQIGATDMRRVEFYARLERIMRAYFEGGRSSRLFPVAIDEDRWRLGGYYVADWVLQNEGDPFTATDLLRDGDDARFDPLLRISRGNVERLLDHLAEHQILDVIREMSPSSTVFGDVAESNAKVFRLAERERRLLYGFVAQNESERGAREVSLGPPRTAAAPAAGDFAGAAQAARPSSGTEQPPAGGSFAAPRPSPRILAGRYELGDLLGQGGLNSVYKARDLILGRPVVAKLLRPGLGNDPQAMARFRREAQIARQLTHPQIAQTYDVLDGDDGNPALIMEWLKGTSLRDQLLSTGPMQPAEVVANGRVLAEALIYIAGQRIVRLDLKPSNIILADRGPVITDLGIALRADPGTPELTQAGQFVGTPAFMPRELIAGIEPDPRADIYGLGLVLYYCLAGQSPWEDRMSQVAIMTAIMNEEVDLTSLDISPEFRRVLARALAGQRDQRFPTAADFREALTDTPEWQLLHAEPAS
jgi:serine/threonine protein kinase